MCFSIFHCKEYNEKKSLYIPTSWSLKYVQHENHTDNTVFLEINSSDPKMVRIDLKLHFFKFHDLVYCCYYDYRGCVKCCSFLCPDKSVWSWCWCYYSLQCVRQFTGKYNRASSFLCGDNFNKNCNLFNRYVTASMSIFIHVFSEFSSLPKILNLLS